MRKTVTTGAVPPVWAIRTKGWVELRKGPQPKPRTTTATVQVQRHIPGTLTWSQALANYVKEKPKTIIEKIQLRTTIHVGGTPFKYLPVKSFQRMAGVIADGEVRAVSPFLAAIWLGLKPEKQPRQTRKEAA